MRSLGIFLGGILILTALFLVSDIQCVRTYLEARAGMASWWQAITSVIAIASAIFLANVPIQQAKRDKISLQRRNADIFVAKNKKKIHHECSRLTRVIDSFRKMKSECEQGVVVDKTYKDFISDIFKMQILSISDYEISYDLSAKTLSLLSESQTSYLMILRGLHGESFGNADLIDSDYIRYFGQNCNDHCDRWFKDDKKYSDILRYLEEQRDRLNELKSIVDEHSLSEGDVQKLQSGIQAEIRWGRVSK